MVPTTVQHVDTSGTRKPTILAYDTRENSLFLVGDIAAYNAHAEFLASRVVSPPFALDTGAKLHVFSEETLLHRILNGQFRVSVYKCRVWLYAALRYVVFATGFFFSFVWYLSTFKDTCN